MLSHGLSLLQQPESNADDAFEASLNCYADSTLFKGNICGPIAASMNESMFLLVLSKWRDAYDGLKETKNYKFVSAAGSLMKIMVVVTCFIYYVPIINFFRTFSTCMDFCKLRIIFKCICWLEF